ncbi:MAG TPA: Arm DNA-binding domain-containing protein [Sphingomonadaceae bacterium]|nr:Arm DNA-binding domain-containing protein [Sphingomonadaceae bacterium]
MSQKVNRLTARGIESLKKSGLHADGDGLYLRVTRTGGKAWVFIFHQAGKRREMGLGPLKGVTLSRAREKASLARQQIADGLDPIRERGGSPNQPTFGAFAATFIEGKASQWKTARYRKHWEASLTNHCKPIWDRRIGEIDTNAVLEVLNPIWATKSNMATKVRGRVESVLAAAKVAGHRTPRD